MGNLSITEYGSIGATKKNRAQAAQEPSLKADTLSFAATTQSPVFTEGTTLIRVVSDVEVYLEFGENPVATLSSTRLPRDRVEYFNVDADIRLAAFDGV